MSSQQETSSNLDIGCVKWFNNKSGFGFISVKTGDYKEKDIFVHHSAINVANEQYKYLVAGEYVEFKVVKCEDEKYEHMASQVSGITGGPLMCETRFQNRSTSVSMGPGNGKRRNEEESV